MIVVCVAIGNAVAVCLIASYDVLDGQLGNWISCITGNRFFHGSAIGSICATAGLI